MNGRSGILLATAVVSGLGAMYGARKLMTREERSEPLREVLIAARALKVEEVLKPDLVKVTKMPTSSVPAGAFSSYQDVADRWIQMPLLEGEAIVDGKLAPKDAPSGMLSRIPEGMRAFAIDVNEQSGVSGFVLPDHRVDIILARQGDSQGKQHAQTILQDVLVLAAGTLTTRPDDKSIQVRTVTVAVTPDQVDRLVSARTEGMLSLALRGLNDHARIEAPKIEEQPPVETRPMLVASERLEPGTVLLAEMLKVEQVPKSVPLSADCFEDAEKVVGRKLKGLIAAGEPVLARSLVSPEDEATKPEPVPAKIEPKIVLPKVGPGMRAVALSLENIEISPGHIAGGDLLDVYCVRSDQPTVSTIPAPSLAAATPGGAPAAGAAPAPPSVPSAAPTTTAECVAQHVRVLCTPWDAHPAPSGSDADSSDAENQEHGKALILEVPVIDVPRLIHSLGAGKLTLTVRHPDDHDVFHEEPPRFGIIHHGAHRAAMREAYQLEAGALVRRTVPAFGPAVAAPPTPGLLSHREGPTGR